MLNALLPYKPATAISGAPMRIDVMPTVSSGNVVTMATASTPTKLAEMPVSFAMASALMVRAVADTLTANALMRKTVHPHRRVLVGASPCSVSPPPLLLAT